MPIRKRIVAALLSALTALAPLPTLTPSAPVASVAVAAGIAGGVSALWPDAAEARSRGSFSSSSGGTRSFGSGGYTRPSSRTPSFGIPSSPSRSPSIGSGGYARPSAPSSGGGFFGGGGSASEADRALSRRSSGGALSQYRADQERSRTPTVATPPAGGSSGGGSGWGTSTRRPSGYSAGYGAAPGAGGYGGWYGGWNPPGWAIPRQRSFGAWDALFLWFLLDHLNRPGYADWFHNHQNDPGYQQWRSEANQRAQDDPQLRQRLDQLDGQLQRSAELPRDPAYLPPDVPADVAKANASESGGGGGGLLTVILLLAIVGGGVVAIEYLRRRRANPKSGVSSMKTSSKMSPLGTAADMIRRKVTGERYEPSLFRVGMTLTLDPTPFLLAGAATKVIPPGGGGTNNLASVEAVGTLTGGGITLHRLYLQGGAGFFQLHLSADGTPEECRWFSLLDEITPADNAEWGFWLDGREGMIGYPQFQTRDGKLYDRRWSPGRGRIEPATFHEVVQDLRGSRTRSLSAMLYAAPTGAADPAPSTEYVLVQAVDQDGSAWVEVRAGIDVNPAALSLA